MAKVIRKQELERFKSRLKTLFDGFIETFDFHKMENPFRPKDWVRIDYDVKDAYQEVWHNAGDILEVRYLAKDGEGLMFHSNLGIHWTHVQRTDAPSDE